MTSRKDNLKKPRGKTTTGKILEQMVIPALKSANYTIYEQQNIGLRLGSNRRHFIDLIAESPKGDRFLISMKWQQSSGTAEQKVPFEVICLADAIMKSTEFSKAYLVLGGPGWTLREFFLGKTLSNHLIHADKVTIVSLETFIARVNLADL